MRTFILIIFILISRCLPAQQYYISENSSYTYEEKDDILYENFYSGFYILPSGTVIAQPYGEGIHIIHNASVKILPHLNQANKSTMDVLAAYEAPNNDIWIFTKDDIVVVRADTIFKHIKPDGEIRISRNLPIINNEAYFSFRTSGNNCLSIYSFNGERLKQRKRFKFLCENLDNYFQGNLVQSLDNSLFINFYDAKADKMRLYKLNEHFSIIGTYILYPHNFLSFVNEHQYTSINPNIGSIKTIVKDSIIELTHFLPQHLIYKNVANHKITDEALFINGDGHAFILQISKNRFWKKVNFSSFYNTSAFEKNYATDSYYVGSTGGLVRVFPYLTKYPAIFKDGRSADVFALGQSKNGSKWIGSYNSNFSIIRDHQIIHSNVKGRWMPGSASFRDMILLINEHTLNGGVCKFYENNITKYTSITDSVNGYYLLQGKDNRIYFGTSLKGLWIADINEVYQSSKPNWKIINQYSGLKLENILSITEDGRGLVWMAQRTKGIAYYDVKKDTAITYLIDDGEIDFGAMCSLTDRFGNVWWGSSQEGLVVLKPEMNKPFKKSDFIKMRHPLLKNNEYITFLCEWNDFLVIGAYDKVLLFDLRSWNESGKELVKYINPYEANFTSTTGQNTCILDQRDSSVWFATGDMLYQWNLTGWLSLKDFRISPTISINNKVLNTSNAQIKFPYNENSLDFQISYQSPDALPRYLTVILTQDNDTFLNSLPSIKDKFIINNLNSGRYLLEVGICQSNGQYEVFKYNIRIDTIFYKKWWFKAIILVLILGLLVYFYKTWRAIELRERRITELNALSLTNQFRPHFILNSINAIMGEAYDKPRSELILDKLGDSIKILFEKRISRQPVHHFLDEWILVKNTIEINKTIYLKDLITNLPEEQIINDINIIIPICLLQIPVENALMHGLNNKEFPPNILKINLFNYPNYIKVIIEDNGVGRKKSEHYNRKLKHGTGIKNLIELITILNIKNKDKIELTFEDEIFPLEEDSGTRVNVIIPKNYKYE